VRSKIRHRLLGIDTMALAESPNTGVNRFRTAVCVLGALGFVSEKGATGLPGRERAHGVVSWRAARLAAINRQRETLGMPNRIRRRLVLRDLGILVAITAVAFVAARLAWEATIEAFGGYDRKQERALPDAIGWFILIESVGLVPLFLVPPRPRFRRVARQPGATASLAVAFTVAVLALSETVVISGAWLRGKLGFLRLVDVLWFIGAPVIIGPAVATGWLVVAVTVGWRPQPNWLDRLGRVWGIAWIVLFVALEFLRAFRD
jgi:hypothetical protein